MPTRRPGVTCLWSLWLHGILTGLALSYFLGPGILVLAYAALGGAITALAMLGPMNAAKPWNVPAHTYPFVLVTWLFLLATQGFSGLSGPTPPSGIVATALDPALSDPLKIVDFFQGVFHSISQVFFKADGVAGVLLLVGLAVNSLAAAAFAVGGAVPAVITAHLIGVESELITSGLQGFSPVLTAIAFGSAFYRPSIGVVGYAALGTVITVIVQSALNVALTPLGLPPLSAPFDVVAWILFRIRK